MKSDNRNIDYNQLISKLQGINPAVEHPMELTDKVMKQINDIPLRSSLMVRVNLNEQQWRIFKGLRIATSVAATLLLGILFLTEWDDVGKTNISDVSYHQEKVKEIQARYVMPHISESLMGFPDINLKSGYSIFEKYQEFKKYNFTYREKLHGMANELTFN